MTITEYDEMVGLVETWWGPESAGPWKDAPNYELFHGLPTDAVYEALTALRDSGKHPDFPPKPPALRAAALDLVRYAPPALPETTERYGWSEWSRRTFGEVVSLAEAVRRSGEAQTLGVPTPSPENPWRRDSHEDRRDAPFDDYSGLPTGEPETGRKYDSHAPVDVPTGNAL